MLRSYLFEAAGVADARPEMVRAESFGMKLVKRNGSVRPRSPSRESSRSLCTHVGRWDRVYLVEEGDCRLAATRSAGCRHRAGNHVLRDEGDGEFDRFYVSVRKADHDSTLNSHRHLTPSCGGYGLAAQDRSVGPSPTR